MRRGSSAAGLLGLTVLAGCATNSAALEEELSRMRRELRSLNQKIADSELKIERLEGRVTLLALGQGGEVAPAPQTPVVSVAGDPVERNTKVAPRSKRRAAPKPAEPKIAEPRIAQLTGPQRSLPVVKLTPTAEDEGAYDQGAIDDGSPPIVIKLGPDDGEKLPVDHSVLAKPDPVLRAPPAALTAKSTPKAEEDERPVKASKAEIKAAYEIALAKLRIDDDPVASRKLFQRFAKRYPGSEYADNVAYWLAECDFAQERYDEAARGFKKLIEVFPRSPKVPDARARMAEARKKAEALQQGEKGQR